MTDEIWTQARGWEGSYEVSNMGRVRSIARKGRKGSGRTYGGKIIKQTFHKSSGYLVVSLSKDNKARQVLLHRLVLSSFKGDAPEGMECCHENGDRCDPRLKNLRWDTRKNNLADKKKHGTWQGGENNTWHKLNAAQVIAIRASNKPHKYWMEKFNVSYGCIAAVIEGRSWKHVEVPHG
ncbi:NUMOD4 motif-containing HNH endonuclease [Serratia aquatilis]|uniref:NUMOD4 motif-containing HNH endonuclease n=1 Tax=Serratia aquatilis TaxID=1737515 RepID=A0ABV6E9L0_9GAMM